MTDPARMEEAVAIMRQAGSIDYATAYAQDLVRTAKKHLDEALDRSKAKRLLLSMADFFIQRQG